MYDYSVPWLVIAEHAGCRVGVSSFSVENNHYSSGLGSQLQSFFTRRLDHTKFPIFPFSLFFYFFFNDDSLTIRVASRLLGHILPI